MIFTWSSKDLCIIFRQWHVTGPWTLLLSLLIVILLTAGYEGVRQLTRRFEAAHVQRLRAFSNSIATGGRLLSFPFLSFPFLFSIVVVWSVFIYFKLYYSSPL